MTWAGRRDCLAVAYEMAFVVPPDCFATALFAALLMPEARYRTAGET